LLAIRFEVLRQFGGQRRFNRRPLIYLDRRAPPNKQLNRFCPQCWPTSGLASPRLLSMISCNWLCRPWWGGRLAARVRNQRHQHL